MKRDRPGLLALLGLTGALTAVFVPVLTWGKLGRDQAAIDRRTRRRLLGR